MSTGTIFQIMSMTKPVTAAGVMILMEEGRLSLIDPVEKHLPGFKGQMLAYQDIDGSRKLKKPDRPITIVDLMTHTSGMPGGFAAELQDHARLTLAEVIDIQSRQPLDFPPGTRWQYSNTGMATLGRIIEVVSGRSYEQFIAQRILQPLGMPDSFYFPPADKRNRIAAVYRDVDGKLERAAGDVYREGWKYPMPEGGLYSTASDLGRFYQMMLNGGALEGRRILSRASVELMTTLHTGDLKAGFAPGMGYGLGWSVVREPAGMFRLNSIGSFGHGGAYRTYGWVDPRKDMLGVILFQRLNVGGDVADEINAFMAMAAAAAGQ